jgi:acetylornithine deacetylase/succinyl-diaminopimelate desuccinylase-like protein
MFPGDSIRSYLAATWEKSILPALRDYVTIPNQSPAFDPDWEAHGHMDRAVALAVDWIERQQIAGLQLEVVRLPGRTPLLFAEIPGSSDDTVLLYGHLDKQPPLDDWSPGLGPWTPVVRDGRLYGRGAADDGYAAFASATAIRALQREGLAHARCVLVIECCEESGSYDLPHYIEALRERIGSPSLVVCLDSGCGDYERLWVTTSLRGVITGDLTASTLTEGVHSGAASGIVPSSFRVLRQLLERIENRNTGEITVADLHVPIPEQRRTQAAAAAAALGTSVYSEFPFQPGARPASDDLETLLLNRTWRPQLEVTGAAGLPGLAAAGNVLRAATTLKLSMRLPPSADAQQAGRRLKEVLEKDPPGGARVSFAAEGFAANGWNSPPVAPWLEQSLQAASQEFFGNDACYLGEGGTIPFMAMLGDMFPAAQFVITGVLGPHSNAHGPNEFLDLKTGERLTACIARVLHDHAARAT